MKIKNIVIVGGGSAGLIYIAAGLGYTPVSQRHIKYLSKLHPEILTAADLYKKNMAAKKSRMDRLIKYMPSPYEYLKKNIYKE